MNKHAVSLVVLAFIIIAGLLFTAQLVSKRQDAYMTNERPYIRMIAPKQGEVLHAGQLYAIRWEANGVENVYISLQQLGKDRGYLTQGGIPASNQTFDWQVPSEFVASFGEDDYKIVIDDNGVNDISSESGLFSIKAK